MSKNIVIYPVVITRNGAEYFIEIPALTGYTQATSVEEAFVMARDYIGQASIEYKEQSKAMPASNFDLPKDQGAPFKIHSLIDVDLDEYKVPVEMVERTITIPDSLAKLAKARNMDLASTMAEAIEQKLGL